MTPNSDIAASQANPLYHSAGCETERLSLAGRIRSILWICWRDEGAPTSVPRLDYRWSSSSLLSLATSSRLASLTNSTTAEAPGSLPTAVRPTTASRARTKDNGPLRADAPRCPLSAQESHNISKAGKALPATLTIAPNSCHRRDFIRALMIAAVTTVSSEAHLDVGNLDNLFRVPSLSTRRRFLGTAGDAHENS